MYSIQHYVIELVWFAKGLSFSPGTPVSSTNKTDRHIFNWNIFESGIKHYNTNINPTNIYFYPAISTFAL